MTDDELKILKEQQALLEDFLVSCRNKKWDPIDVFFSNVPFCVNPDNRDQFCPTGLDRGNAAMSFVKQHREKYGNIDAIRQRPKVRVEFSTKGLNEA